MSQDLILHMLVRATSSNAASSKSARKQPRPVLTQWRVSIVFRFDHSPMKLLCAIKLRPKEHSSGLSRARVHPMHPRHPRRKMCSQCFQRSSHRKSLQHFTAQILIKRRHDRSKCRQSCRAHSGQRCEERSQFRSRRWTHLGQHMGHESAWDCLNTEPFKFITTVLPGSHPGV